MFDTLVAWLTDYPYAGVALVFLICGLGFPLPEELVLISAGYVCFKDWAQFPLMIATSVAAILVGDLVPFFLGHTFGTRLLRLRPLRILISKRRLSKFDRWFRRRGDLVIFFARFVTGLRIVAYFTAGTMKMKYWRFLVLDLVGIVIVAPTLIWIGYRFGNIIDDAIAKVQQVERGILVGSVVVVALAAGIYWIRQRRTRGSQTAPSDTFVGPPARSDAEAAQESGATDTNTAEQ